MRVRSCLPFRRSRHVQLSRSNAFVHLFIVEVHHILAEIIQGGLVLETNVQEIGTSGSSYFCLMRGILVYETFTWTEQCSVIRYLSDTPFTYSLSVRAAAKARRESFTSANPLALGVGGGAASRNGGLQTPLGWLTEKITGVGAR